MAGLIALGGCKEEVKTFAVKGRIHDKGAPLKLGKDGRIILSLTPEEAGQSVKGTTYNAEVDKETGTFTVPGKDKKGIPAGKYKVSVMVLEGIGPPSPNMDKLKGRFMGANALLKTIEGETELDIDVSKPK